MILELIRGIRLHFEKFIKELKEGDLLKAQRGLGHGYSRAKVKFNIHRVDNMIIQSISLLDQLDKDLNTFSTRCKEWYSWHFPELVRIVPDNGNYARLCKLIKDKNELDESMLPALEEITNDREKAQAILNAARASMGTDISPVDMINIERFADRVVELTKYRTKLHQYLVDKINVVAPNLATLVGEQVAARLIAHAGSLTNLAKYPASTVQILGAEKALFRALKTRGNTPKYGLLFNSSFIGRASTKNKGRISRYLANKCSIAARIDSFSELSTHKFGEKLKEQVEERLKFYDTGEAPKKNVDAMKEVIEEIQKEQTLAQKDGTGNQEKKEKKKKKEKREKKEKKEKVQEKEKKGKEQETKETEQEEEEENKEKKEKKNKKEKKREKKRKQVEEQTQEEIASPKKKKRKEKEEKVKTPSKENTNESNGDKPKKKKKKKSAD